MTDIVKELCATKCNREPFTPSHAECQCLVANKAAYEIQRLRADVKFVREQIDEYVASRFDPGMMSPTLDRIRWHFWDQDDTANTAANTVDVETDQNDATS